MRNFFWRATGVNPWVSDQKSKSKNRDALMLCPGNHVPGSPELCVIDNCKLLIAN